MPSTSEDLLFQQVQYLKSQSYSSPLSQSFHHDITKLYDLYDTWQNEILAKGKPVTCSTGCSHCCSHWVEDVYSFEAIRIAEVIMHELPKELVAHLIDVCQQDEEELLDIVEECGSDDEIEILNLFFQKSRPCPLLMEDKSCAIYQLRPLTCRSFYSRKDSELCKPEHTYDEEQATFTVQPVLPVEDLLDDVDDQFITESGPTGLRSQLWRELEKMMKRS